MLGNFWPAASFSNLTFGRAEKNYVRAPPSVFLIEFVVDSSPLFINLLPSIKKKVVTVPFGLFGRGFVFLYFKMLPIGVL